MNRHLGIFAGLAVLAACAMPDGMPTAAEGEQIFAENCAACHDYRGQGGTISAGVSAPDLTRLAESNGGEFPRAAVLSKIDGYGQGHMNSDVMPEFGTILAGEQVPVEVDGVMTPTPRSLAALLAFLESVQVAG